MKQKKKYQSHSKRYSKTHSLQQVAVMSVSVVIIISIAFLVGKMIEATATVPTSTVGTKNTESKQEQNMTPKSEIEETNQNTPSIDKSLPTQETWEIRLVNQKHFLPEDFTVELESIDKDRKFDKRAYHYLMNMIEQMRKDGVSNIWVQSAYRSVASQQEVFNSNIQTLMSQGKTQEEAENITLKSINRPGTSEHNLGLAVDLNYVNLDFKNTKAYQWLIKNADKYGFVLRYPEDKEEITGIEYEPWHWRYVGEEHAKKMKEKNLCLEEYMSNIYPLNIE